MVKFLKSYQSRCEIMFSELILFHINTSINTNKVKINLGCMYGFI